jgi:3-methyladenine DNA glycosylase/8-oxoguanine DNA glycosylase
LTAAGATARRSAAPASPWADAPVQLRAEVRPPWPFRLGGGSSDGLLRRRGAGIQRWLHVGEEPVLVAVVQPAGDRVLFAARAGCAQAAAEGIARLRFATGVDDDLRPFHDRFRDDPVIGRAVRADPYLRVRRKCRPWEALLAAITEQLIEFERAAAIQRRLIARLGLRCPHSGLRDVPPPAVVAAQAPAWLASLDLAPARAAALRRCAREVAAGRIDLAGRDARRLRAIPGIGAWTVEMLALHGQGRMDVLPAADVGYLKLVGRVRTGDPRARTDEDDVRSFFEPYGEWKGLAGEYLRAAGARGLIPTAPRPAPPGGGRTAARAGTPW